MTIDTLNHSRQMNSTAEQESPWHKQFWVWFIIVLLVTTVIAGVTTVIIAVKHDDSLVVDNYYKEGLAINRVITQKENAVKLGVVASLSFNAENQMLNIVLSEQHASANNIIKIRLVHATISEFDREHFLTRNSDDGYAVKLGSVQPGWWRIIIEPVDAQWQIEQRVQFPIESMLTIKPAL